jgi:predicted NBD/HSP70 family sugar kinase
VSSRAEVLDAFTTAIVTAVSAVAVTLDPESVFFVGRLRPLVDEVLHEVRRRLDRSLTTAPEVKAPAQVLGLSVARGAVYACLTMARSRLRDAVLEARRQVQNTEQATPAF